MKASEDMTIDELYNSLTEGMEDLSVRKHTRARVSRRTDGRAEAKTYCGPDVTIKGSVAPLGKVGEIKVGDKYIIKGIVHVIHSAIGVEIRPDGKKCTRFRVLRANGTEVDLLDRSIKSALYSDDTARRII